MHDIMEEHTQDSLEIVHEDEEAYLNVLVVHQLQFESYKYD
jgi:hypothetical protein